MERIRAPLGWKMWAMRLFDRLLFSLPFVSELFNQGLSKNLGIMAAWHFLSRTEVEGDYAEFGVFRGETFRNAYLAAKRIYRTSRVGSYRGRFFAFDAFQGLPDAASLQGPDNIYEKGEFCASRLEFNRTLGRLSKSSEVIVTEGWFNEVLNPQRARSLGLTKLAFVNIDCDLYESTVPVLAFITPFLQTGTVIYFDDWFSLKGSMSTGEGKATQEWLEQNPEIKLVEYRNVGVTGKMFIVNCVRAAAKSRRRAANDK